MSIDIDRDLDQFLMICDCEDCGSVFAGPRPDFFQFLREAKLEGWKVVLVGTDPETGKRQYKHFSTDCH